jgi:transcriptional regulator with XRE-family HTH domain
MTQMNLADEMGVSYQAVSNWERGNSMPDISKLPELCKILDLSFDELVGETTPETEITKRLMENEDAEVTLEEMAQVGQLVAPEKMEEKVNETIKTEGKIPFSVLVSMAPFVDRETLGKAAEEVAPEAAKEDPVEAPKKKTAKKTSGSTGTKKTTSKSTGAKKSTSKSTSAKKSAKSSSGTKTSTRKKKAEEPARDEADIMTLEEIAANIETLEKGENN